MLAGRVPAALTFCFASLRSASPKAAVSPVATWGMSTKRSMVRIGTHSGTFHCDEALGCFLLKQTPLFKDAEIVRSRDPEVLKDLDVVIDVGGTYEPGAPPATLAASAGMRRFAENGH